MNSYYCGVDVGSTWAKAVAVDGDGNVMGRGLARTGMSFELAAKTALDELLAKIDAEPRHITATGYGRRNVEGAQSNITEITCHAKGAHYYFQERCQVIDIGGQDNKIIHIDENGAVDHFTMNRKCAAGTGAFIEEIARRLDISLDELESLAEQATKDMVLSSYCTVFSATEVIKLIREGTEPADICKGIFNSVVARVVEMGTLGDTIVLTGGVVEAFPIVASIMEKKTGATVKVPPHAQFVGALGAALISRESS